MTIRQLSHQPVHLKHNHRGQNRCKCCLVKKWPHAICHNCGQLLDRNTTIEGCPSSVHQYGLVKQLTICQLSHPPVHAIITICGHCCPEYNHRGQNLCIYAAWSRNDHTHANCQTNASICYRNWLKTSWTKSSNRGQYRCIPTFSKYGWLFFNNYFKL